MSDVRVITLCEAIREAYAEEMRRDERVFMLGTCIQTPTFPHTKGLCEEFGAARGRQRLHRVEEGVGGDVVHIRLHHVSRLAQRPTGGENDLRPHRPRS
jgi:hypothetical protein